MQLAGFSSGSPPMRMDANPDRETLSDKLTLETSATVRDLLNESDQVKEVRGHRGR